MQPVGLRLRRKSGKAPKPAGIFKHKRNITLT